MIVQARGGRAPRRFACASAAGSGGSSPGRSRSRSPAQELSALRSDGKVAHISGDLPVVADVAIVNKVTNAEKVWDGTRGLLGLLATPGYTGRGVGVAVIDSGIAAHAALNGRVVARVNLVSTEPGVSGDPFGHGTHVAGLIGGSCDGGVAR